LNPLDLTGFVMRDPDLLREIFSGYADAAGVDALVLCWWAGEGDEGWAKTLLGPYAQVAAKAGIPLIVSPVEATAIGSWTAAYREQGLAFCRGLRSTFRALRALGVAGAAPLTGGPPAELSPTAPPRLVQSDLGPMVAFADAMGLLESAGIAVAPYVVLAEDAEDDPAIGALGDRVVVKLADVPHRTELGAVRVGVAPSDIVGVVRELRAIATEQRVPGTVAVQAMVHGNGEAFIGIQGATDLGPVLLFGRGGILLELARRVGGRMLPLGSGAARSLIAEVAADVGAVRGQAPWPLDPLVGAVDAAGRLWQLTGSWLASADLNPLIVTNDGAIAVDALLVARTDDPASPTGPPAG
jgi:acyl-CoA synthetase (NDP forming)